MIKNQWYVVLKSSEVKRNKLTGVVRLGEKLAFWRDGETNEVKCIIDKCSHRGASLSAGKVIEGKVRCPFHGLKFDGSGRCIEIPANGKNTPVPERFNVQAYKTIEKAGFIWIFWSAETKPDAPENSFPPLPFFEDIDEDFKYLTWIDPWSCHYSRCIENQLDVIHLPFVHHNTIGRGGATLVNGPRVEVVNNEMNVWVYNSRDTGQKPEKPEETAKPELNRQHLHFRFPHLWQNWLTDKARIFIAFVPVDEEHSLLYLRFYQKFVTFPGLAWLVNTTGMWFSRIITHQDRRVVHTQRPKKTALKMGEHLLQGDGPIIAYRKIREELQQ